MKLLFYAAFALTGLVAAFYVIVGLFDNSAPSSFRDKAFLITAALSMMAMLVWAYRVGERQGNFTTALGIVVLSWVVFLVIMAVEFFTNNRPWH